MRGAAVKHKRYTHIGLLVPILLISLAFLIPLGSDPDLCYDSITPNRLQDDMSCAWTASLLGAGALGATFWVFLKMLNLLILFTKQSKSVDDSPILRVTGILLGILVPGTLLTVTLTVTGASYRIGQTCLPNHEHSIATLWSWLLAFSGGSLACFCATTVVIVRRLRKFKNMNRRHMRERRPVLVVLAAFWTRLCALSGWNRGDTSAGRFPHPHPHPLPPPSRHHDTKSFIEDTSTHTPLTSPQHQQLHALPAYGGGDGTSPTKHISPMLLKHYLTMQWRNMLTSIAVVTQAIFFTVVFWSQDRKLGKSVSLGDDSAERQATARWSKCLVENVGSRERCLADAAHLTVPRGVILGAFILASVGFVACPCFFYTSFVANCVLLAGWLID
ncbi:hypothetical protein EJ05DRAFT_260326 [Pseudovirgaria hyperparasitica]|uniref:G-protein coupled receptors family 2 profile 2 domain-containing protein n=1 Tax=Pseudovirgaria hyperparasitica TaxID=470096 RepID=A0A6A6WGY1_9PEZI|nr:uncharacterized protein EJ05DRAFT_260326 [Pseudovirgaria hyperparasitica]KAF2761345.1 hypothetical protein EJ05DRAFT_260326 [Pseudovirgaria hyperparasitica]